MIRPFTLQPLYMERPWGGRALERLYHRPLPPDLRIGESWEVVDREEAQSVVADGPLAGRSLHELWRDHRVEIFGESSAADARPRFPLLVKILDAEETLSIQVHPPAKAAARLGGEPKTEMWFVAEARGQAALHVGVQPGVTRDSFREALTLGTVEQLVPRLPVRAGDSIFIPSGRLHAIGGGLVIFEIQQNSDTTYRVFDWNRRGLDGKPRALHIGESLACIDFNDTAPALNPETAKRLADCGHFTVDRHVLEPGRSLTLPGFCLLAVTSGAMALDGRNHPAGAVVLVPAAGGPAEFLAAEASGVDLLEIRMP